MKRKQNTLFLLADQWPAAAFGFRGAGIATPAMDRLASDGTVFTQAFTPCPLCTPARGALLTAKWPHQTGVQDNSALGYSTQESLGLEQTTWIETAVDNGFHVGYYGKWHLGANNPESRGAHRFDPNVETECRPYDPDTDWYSYEAMAQRYERQSRSVLTRGRAPFWGRSRHSKESTQPFPVVTKGMAFLEDWAGGDRDAPFFLTLSLPPPHFPHYLPPTYADLAEQRLEQVELPPSFEDSFQGKPSFHARPWWPCMDTSMLTLDEWRTVIAYSQAHIMLVDEAIGRLLDALDNLDLADSTTVVFTADHGDMAGAHNRFDKGPYFYDDVWRIPLIVRRPKCPAKSSHAFVSLIDVGRTLFELAGAQPEELKTRSGNNLLPVTADPKAGESGSDCAFGVYDAYNGMSFAIRAIRTDRWKYVWNAQDVDELYDMQEDPFEMENRIENTACQPIARTMRTRLLQWMSETGDPFPGQVDDLPPAGTILATGDPGP